MLEAMARGNAPDPGRLRQVVEFDPTTEELRRAGFPPEPARRAAMFRETAQLCPALRLRAAGYDVEALMSLEELWRFYLPLCRAVLGLAESLPEGRRALVGVAGPGASGKTVLAGLLCKLLGRLAGGEGNCIVCPLDGFHHPNAYLEAHFTRDASGRRVPLRAVKGAPESFDAAAFVAALRRLRVREAVSWPGYDRRMHDPVPDAIRIGAADRIALVEGNYLLLERGPWTGAADLLDLRLFVDAPQEELRRAMVARHMRGGRSRADAKRHYKGVDLPNARLIRASGRRADLVLCRSGRRAAALRRPC